MQKIGEISHLAKSGRAIVRLAKRVDEGQILCDEKNVKVAKVVELIGPVSHPYASASILTNNTKKLVGAQVFSMEPSSAVKQKKYRRNQK